MAPSKRQQRLGTYITSSVAGETVRAFIPHPLPPVPELQLKGLHQHLDRANQELGRLNGMTRLLPDIRFLLYLYTRKEALVSSQIEGTQSSFADLLLWSRPRRVTSSRSRCSIYGTYMEISVFATEISRIMPSL